MHIVPIDIYVYTSSCTCYVPFTFTLLLKIFTLFTLHITVLTDNRKLNRNCCPAAKHESSCFLAQTWLSATWAHLWMMRYFCKKNVSCQKNCMKTYYVCSICIISVSFYEVLHMRSKANLTFSDVSVWMRNFWKTLMWTESILKQKLSFQMYSD